jgi:hypothetical protein
VSTIRVEVQSTRIRAATCHSPAPVPPVKHLLPFHDA